MLTCDDRILLTEFLGECWHDDPIFREYIPGVEHIQFVELECSKCHGHYLKNRTFATWQDTGDLKERIVEMGEWYQFAKFAKRSWDAEQVGKKFVYDDLYFSAVLMNPIRFPELVAGWLKEREEK